MQIVVLIVAAPPLGHPLDGPKTLASGNGQRRLPLRPARKVTLRRAVPSGRAGLLDEVAGGRSGQRATRRHRTHRRETG